MRLTADLKASDYMNWPVFHQIPDPPYCRWRRVEDDSPDFRGTRGLARYLTTTHRSRDPISVTWVHHYAACERCMDPAVRHLFTHEPDGWPQPRGFK